MNWKINYKQSALYIVILRQRDYDMIAKSTTGSSKQEIINLLNEIQVYQSQTRKLKEENILLQS